MKNLIVCLLVLGCCFVGSINTEAFGGLGWENIGRQIRQVNTIWIDEENPQIILAGTSRGVFKTEDGGVSWRKILFGANRKVNFLYVDQAQKQLIYAACDRGLFFSSDSGDHWQRIYQSDPGVACICLAINEDKIYLGTETGLLTSSDGGHLWRRALGLLGKASINATAVYKKEQVVFLAATGGAYRVNLAGEAEKVFDTRLFNASEADEDLNDDDYQQKGLRQITDIYINRSGLSHIYLATTTGLFKSDDGGRDWQRFSDFGLLSQKLCLITARADSTPVATTKSRVFTYQNSKWQELPLGLSVGGVQALVTDGQGNIYTGADNGLFKSVADSSKIADSSPKLNIRQVQQAALRYAQVIDPSWIASSRRLSRIKSLLPDVSLDYDKTISTYNSSTIARFTTGPRDWGISLKWSLSDLVWSEQQRLIDSQVRLMVQLRQDILDEVTRLYFERQRVQSEIIVSAKLSPEQLQHKKLKLEELTALLDGLTGGYISGAKCH